jgi:multiple sugar transport system substrate-binding protein
MVPKLVVVALVSSSLVLSLGASIVQPTYPAYTKQATIKWWSWTTNPQNVIKAFEKQYPSIHVVRENVGSGATEYTKLLTAIKAGSGAPDLVQIEFDHLPQFIATGGLRDLAPLGAKRYRPYVLPWTWNQVSQGHAVYAIPEDSGPTVLFYNAKIFSKYGLAVPRTWTDFAADAAKLHKANPHIYMSFYDPLQGHWFLSLAWAAGAHPFAQTGANSWKVNLTSAPILKVAHLWLCGGLEQFLLAAGDPLGRPPVSADAGVRGVELDGHQRRHRATAVSAGDHRRALFHCATDRGVPVLAALHHQRTDAGKLEMTATSDPAAHRPPG